MGTHIWVHSTPRTAKATHWQWGITSFLQVQIVETCQACEKTHYKLLQFKIDIDYIRVTIKQQITILFNLFKNASSIFMQDFLVW